MYARSRSNADFAFGIPLRRIFETLQRLSYSDTSAIGGCLDDECRQPSSRLMALFECGERVLVLSDLTLRELGRAPAAVRTLLDAIPDEMIEVVSLTEEAAELAREYLRAGVVTTKMRVDAQHIAVATVARVDVLVSWNLKHIVNLRRIQGYNSVNLRLGYPLLEIRTPQEDLSDE
jgi:hypothetical protein